MENKQVNKIALGTFIGLTMALCATVRRLYVQLFVVFLR